MGLKYGSRQMLETHTPERTSERAKLNPRSLYCIIMKSHPFAGQKSLRWKDGDRFQSIQAASQLRNDHAFRDYRKSS